MKRLLSFIGLMLTASSAFAAEEGAAAFHAAEPGHVAIGAGIAVGLALLGGTLGQGRAVASGLEAVGRNPAASDKIQLPMIIGLVFMEVLGILSFVIALFLVNKI